MRPVEFLNLFNPCSLESKRARQDFTSLDLNRKISVIAVTVFAALATAWTLGFAAILIFRVMVDKLLPRKQPSMIYSAERIQQIMTPAIERRPSEVHVPRAIQARPIPKPIQSPDTLPSHVEVSRQVESVASKLIPVPEQDIPEENSKGIDLAKRWAFKIIPELIPETKIPLQLYKTGTTVQKAKECYDKQDYMGCAKKVAPYLVGGAALLYGGPVVTTAAVLYKAYGYLNLLADTANHLNEQVLPTAG